MSARVRQRPQYASVDSQAQTDVAAGCGSGRRRVRSPSPSRLLRETPGCRRRPIGPIAAPWPARCDKAGRVTIEPPAPGEPRRPLGPRDPGDAWVVAPTGSGTGVGSAPPGCSRSTPSAACCCSTACRGVTSATPGRCPAARGTRASRRRDGALREAAEEAGVPDAAIRPRLLSVLDLGYWSYTTLVGDVIAPFEPTISDPESRELAWVPAAEVDDQPLHPGFASSWEQLRAAARHPSRDRGGCRERRWAPCPDGWWRDRAGAAERLHRPDRRARGGRACRRRARPAGAHVVPGVGRGRRGSGARGGRGRGRRRGRAGRGIRRRRDRRARRRGSSRRAARSRW